MKVLLTGGSGLIGREIGKRLVARGDTVVSLVRDVGQARASEPFPAERYSWSTPEKELVAILSRVDAVIHLAGEPIADGRWNEARKQAIRHSRIDSTRRLAQAIRAAAGVKVLVQASAIGIYGDRGDEVLSTASSRGAGFLGDVVSDWESASHGLSGVRVVWVRTGVVLARQGGALAKMLPIFRAGLGARLGFAGNQWLSWIHLDDIVALFLFALDHPEITGPIDGVAPEPVTNKSFTTALCRHLGVFESPPVPQAALHLLYGEMASVVLASCRVEAKPLLEAGFRFLYPILESALADLCEPLQNLARELVAEQWVPQPPERIWSFFSDARNLSEITPEFLDFSIRQITDAQIKEGTEISYRLHLHGVPFGWTSRLESWQPPRTFVDNQIRGPFALWRHTHEFLPAAGGTLLRDRVRYRLPLGWLGNVIAGWKVDADVTAIFRYRRARLAVLFGGAEASAVFPSFG